MQCLRNRVGLVAFGLSTCWACKNSDPAPEAKTSSSVSVPTAAPVASAAAAPAPTSTATTKKVCPFPRRCDDACKKAHFAAMDKCSPLWKDVEKAVPNVNEMGACTAACLKTPNNAGCVGAATKDECECSDKCSAGIPAELKAKGDPYLSCYAGVVAAACY